jgi:hypothetical protein
MNSSSIDPTAEDLAAASISLRPSRRARAVAAALLSAAVLALAGAGYAAAQIPGGSAAGFGTGGHCH